MIAILVIGALIASAISGAIGMGGGVALVALMASLLEPALVIPVHAVVQLASNSTRGLVLLRRIHWRIFLSYVPTALLGVLVGMRFYAGEGLPWLRPAIGVFVLVFLAWDRFKPAHLRLPIWAFLPAGFFGGVLMMLVGASGPYLAAFFLRDDLDREQIVATKAAIQSAGHLMKLPAFLALGFAYRDHVGLMAPLIAAALVGTLLGTRILRRMPERYFQVAFRLLLALLGMRLLLTARF